MKQSAPLELIAPGLFLFILPFTHTTPLRFLCLALSIASVVFSLKRHLRAVPPKAVVVVAIVFWFAVCLLAVFNSIDREYSWGEFKNEVCWTIIAFCVFYFLTDSADSWRRWRAILLVQLFAISFLAIGSFFWNGHDWVRKAWVGDRNAFSTYVVLMFPFLLAMISAPTGSPFSSHSSRHRRLLASGGIVLALVAGALTLNRMLWLALAFEALAFGVLLFWRVEVVGDRRKLQWRPLAATGIGLVVLAAVFVLINREKPTGTGVSHLSETENLQRSFSHDPRLEVWSYAMRRARERPWTGHGYGRGILRADFRDRFQDPLKWHGHNIVVDYAIEAGIPGVVAIVGLFAAFFYQCWKLYRSADAAVWPLGAWGLAVLVGITVKSMTDDILIRDNALLLWSILGMILGLGLRRQARPALREHAARSASA